MRVGVTDAEAVVSSPEFVDADERGNPRYTGYIGNLRVRIVVALDDPTWIITIHRRRK